MLLFISSSYTRQDQKGVDPEKYIKKYMAIKSDFIQKDVEGNIQYSMFFVPAEIKLMSLYKKGVLTQEIYDAYSVENSKYKEFILELSIQDHVSEFLKYECKNTSSYQERLQYYSFDMKNDIYAVFDDYDTVKCHTYLFERNFGISPKGNFTIGFECPRKYNTCQIIIRDQVYGKGSEFKFNYSKQIIDKLPSLKNYRKWKK